MSEQHEYRAIIPLVPEDSRRPLWSVMIPTYNCADYLRETLTSVLAQDPGPEVMHIEVVDDHSTQDDPAAVVKELGRGRVNFYRQPKNVGSIRNFNTCLQRSRGHLIHLLHGDDCVRDGFYHKLQRGFEENPEIGAAFCRYIYIDEHSHWQHISWLEQPESGVLDNWLERIAVQQRIQPPSMVVQRSVYEKHGGFDSRICCCAEDWEMWLRIASHYQIWYETEPLALYRIQSKSLTGRCARTGQNIRDLRKIIEFSQSYLRTPIASQLTHQARENFARYYLKELVPKMISEGDLVAATNQLRELLNFSHSLTTIKRVTYLALLIGNHWITKRNDIV
ncbi:MAG: glycosyltransferase [Spirirestis rafaelensis WJT71-NPBG6]|jgi:glycosyltransferase involved in cell wall biosynthesis|nr:glycosyltransferase [Spirirestis rafaelensis WJT71-NPBG6]